MLRAIVCSLLFEKNGSGFSVTVIDSDQLAGLEETVNAVKIVEQSAWSKFKLLKRTGQSKYCWYSCD